MACLERCIIVNVKLLTSGALEAIARILTRMEVMKSHADVKSRNRALVRILALP